MVLLLILVKIQHLAFLVYNESWQPHCHLFFSNPRVYKYYMMPMLMLLCCGFEPRTSHLITRFDRSQQAARYVCFLRNNKPKYVQTSHVPKKGVDVNPH